MTSADLAHVALHDECHVLLDHAVGVRLHVLRVTDARALLLEADAVDHAFVPLRDEPLGDPRRRGREFRARDAGSHQLGHPEHPLVGGLIGRARIRGRLGAGRHERPRYAEEDPFDANGVGVDVHEVAGLQRSVRRLRAPRVRVGTGADRVRRHVLGAAAEHARRQYREQIALGDPGSDRRLELGERLGHDRAVLAEQRDLLRRLDLARLLRRGRRVDQLQPKSLQRKEARRAEPVDTHAIAAHAKLPQRRDRLAREHTRLLAGVVVELPRRASAARRRRAAASGAQSSGGRTGSAFPRPERQRSA